jgi:DNA-binding NarL/FixJ family response regulator
MATSGGIMFDREDHDSVGAIATSSRGTRRRPAVRSNEGSEPYSLSELARIVDIVELELRIESARRAAEQVHEELGRVRSDLEALTDAVPQAGRADRGRTLLAKLTRQERRIALLAADGLSNVKIAAEIDISAETVRGHMKGVFRKLGIRSRWELAYVLDPTGRAVPSSQ